MKCSPRFEIDWLELVQHQGNHIRSTHPLELRRWVKLHVSEILLVHGDTWCNTDIHLHLAGRTDSSMWTVSGSYGCLSWRAVSE